MWFTIFLIFLIICLLTLVGGLIKALIIQTKKNEIHEKWIVDLQNKVDSVYITMHRLDDKQMFAKDDEVGTVFQEMVELINTLNNYTSKD